uniref:Sugar phosphate transporter domain-containing protein n=1 Tax=Fagus sylvatica TaxID=28930 RepID=A0A2N9G0E2_FAGSY
MSEGQKFQLGTIGALSLSVVSSVSIVICNKALISTLGFTFATTLTSWHLLVTFCSLHVALWMKMFEHKPFDPRAVMGFGILNGISIGLLNLSLGFNSVGFYQEDIQASLNQAPTHDVIALGLEQMAFAQVAKMLVVDRLA